MKTKISIFASIVFVCLFTACNVTQNNAHSSQNSLDWAGLYKGTVSSSVEGCSGEIVLLTINSNLTYTQQSACLEGLDNAKTASGTFAWNKLGSEITLTDAATNAKTIYQVRENLLKKVSENGKRVEYASSDLYDLKKLPAEKITEKYWKLIELNGNPVVNDGTFNREPYIIFKADNRINGTGGCNIFNGSYELQESTNRIKMSQVISSMMACANMEIEGELLRILQSVDNYTMSADGTTLSLNKARMAPLARFEVVYLK